MELEKEDKFYFFKNLFKKAMPVESNDTANTIASKKEEQKLQAEKQKIEEEISFIIDNKNDRQFRILMDNDVLLSANHVWKVFFESPGLISKKTVDMAYTHYGESMNKWTLEVFETLNHYIKNGEDFYGADKAGVKYKRKINFDNICSFILESDGKYLKDKNTIDRLYILNKDLKLNISNLTHTSFLDETATYPRRLEYVLEARYNEFNQDGVMNLVKRAKVLNDKNIQTSIAKNIISSIEKYDTQKLPSESKIILKEINQLFLDIEEKKLNQEENFKVNNLYEKRLPQVLSEYFSIPDRYRATLESNKETPDFLLKDSLNEIKTHLSQINNQIHEQSLDDMKKTNKYLKAI